MLSNQRPHQNGLHKCEGGPCVRASFNHISFSAKVFYMTGVDLAQSIQNRFFANQWGLYERWKTLNLHTSL